METLTIKIGSFFLQSLSFSAFFKKQVSGILLEGKAVFSYRRGCVYFFFITGDASIVIAPTVKPSAAAVTRIFPRAAFALTIAVAQP
jgi:hypothetical protein